MNRDNITQQLENYITENKNDQGEAWEYIHEPYLTEVINKLGELESMKFSSKMWDWDDSHLSAIADPIIFSSNKYLDSDFLYIKIFSKIKNIDDLDYLSENIITHIPLYPKHTIESWELDLILTLKEQILKTIEIKSGSWQESLHKVAAFFDDEINKRKQAKPTIV